MMLLVIIAKLVFPQVKHIAPFLMTQLANQSRKAQLSLSRI